MLLFIDWPEKNFSGQSEAGDSNASGTGSVRVSAKGLISPIFKTKLVSSTLRTVAVKLVYSPTRFVQLT